MQIKWSAFGIDTALNLITSTRCPFGGAEKGTKKMLEIIIRGKKPTCIKKEEIRALALCSISVLGYHNYFLRNPAEPVYIDYTASDKKLGNNKITGGKNGGWANRFLQQITVDNRPFFSTEKEDKAWHTDTIIHEVIHLCGISGEHITTNLVPAIKPTVVSMADSLARNTYRRAAHFAHSRPGMAYYKTPEEDFYSSAEDNSPRLTTTGTSTQ